MRNIYKYFAMSVLVCLTVWALPGQAARPRMVCPSDGKKSYFGVCPGGEEPVPAAEATSDNRDESRPPRIGDCNASRRPDGGSDCPPKGSVTSADETSRLPFEPEMVAIPAGSVLINNTFTLKDDEGNFDMGKQSTLDVAAFQISKYEVTQRQWKLIMDNNPSKFHNCLDCPVENVTLSDVQDYLRKLNEKTGKSYRLPTEAEWMYACHGGDPNEWYCGGNNIDVVAWYSGNSDGKTHPVGKKVANGFGLYDMSGNVSEKCQPYSDHSGEIQVAIGGSYTSTRIKKYYVKVDFMCNTDNGSKCFQEDIPDSIVKICNAERNSKCFQHSGSSYDFCNSDNGSTCTQYSGFRLAL